MTRYLVRGLAVAGAVLAMAATRADAAPVLFGQTAAASGNTWNNATGQFTFAPTTFNFFAPFGPPVGPVPATVTMTLTNSGTASTLAPGVFQQTGMDGTFTIFDASLNVLLSATFTGASIFLASGFGSFSLNSDGAPGTLAWSSDFNIGYIGGTPEGSIAGDSFTFYLGSPVTWTPGITGGRLNSFTFNSQGNFNATNPPLPEPSTVILSGLVLGGLGIAGLRARARRRVANAG